MHGDNAQNCLTGPEAVLWLGMQAKASDVLFFLCDIVTFICHRSEIGVCFVHKPDWNMKEVSEMQGHISMYVVEGLAEQREFVDKPCSDGVCKNQELANF